MALWAPRAVVLQAAATPLAVVMAVGAVPPPRAVPVLMLVLVLVPSTAASQGVSATTTSTPCSLYGAISASLRASRSATAFIAAVL